MEGTHEGIFLSIFLTPYHLFPFSIPSCVPPVQRSTSGPSPCGWEHGAKDTKSRNCVDAANNSVGTSWKNEWRGDKMAARGRGSSWDVIYTALLFTFARPSQPSPRCVTEFLFLSCCQSPRFPGSGWARGKFALITQPPAASISTTASKLSLVWILCHHLRGQASIPMLGAGRLKPPLAASQRIYPLTGHIKNAGEYEPWFLSCYLPWRVRFARKVSGHAGRVHDCMINMSR
ncbi:hypothetical protein BDV59DRAFT_24844 [Aspergillus ambiguus]|uniref:uncharacterized protein n=1 Tax=Aspergillus ambiguus TaxID=176160 RepID=UPI003CCE4CE0